MKLVATALPGVVIVEPRVFQDRRGFFLETYHAERYGAAGLPERFVQDNHSRSVAGTVRGLHYQLRHPQGKLIRAIFWHYFGRKSGSERSEESARQETFLSSHRLLRI